MKDYIHLHSLVFNKPHLCTPEYAETVLAVLGEKLGVEEGLYSVQSEGKDQKDKHLYGSTQVIPIIGSMVHRGSSLDAMSGITSYQSIKASIQSALEDPRVKSILLEMDSPGGSVAGAFDLKDYIQEAKQQKPIYAIANDSMASAAYLIGSACTKVYATQTSRVGSIGVVAMHVDQSEKNKKDGIKPTFISAGDYKVAGNPHEKLEGTALEYLQDSVNESYEMFVNAVATSRGIDAQAVRDTEARVYGAEKAKELGLIDEVASFDSVLSKLADTNSRVTFQSMSKGSKMDKEEIEKLEADFAQVSADLDKLKAENEALRKVALDEGYRITAEGVEKKAVAETLEVDGKTVDLSAMPQEAADMLKAMVADKEAAKLEAKAAEMFPNMDINAAKEFAKMDLSEEALKTLKAADEMFASLMEEVGKSAAQGDMTDPAEQIKKYAKEHNLTEAQAYAELAKTAEGRALINKFYADKKEA